MIKKVFRELGIVLLLILAIGLLLAVLFYDYIPNNKVVPIKLQEYNMPEEIKEEIKDASLDNQNIVRTYAIDSKDLDLYEATNDYKKGKANPFSNYTVMVDSSAQSNTGTSSSSGSVNNTDGSTNSSADNEVYMNTPGKNY